METLSRSFKSVTFKSLRRKVKKASQGTIVKKMFKAPHCKKMIVLTTVFKAWLGKGKASFLFSPYLLSLEKHQQVGSWRGGK